MPAEQQLEAAKLQSAKKLGDQKQLEQQNLDRERYNTIEKHFGKDAAELYNAATEGGKTSILQNLIESKLRGIDLNEKIPESIKDGDEIQDEKPPIKTLDYDKGLTPKERVKRQESRYSTNLPLYQKSVEKRNAYESAQDDIDILKELSPKIGAIERLNINPQTGDLIIPALASPEAQRFLKTINEFTRSAKDTYGSRVTNFDLTQFLKRLPTLANSEEGRRQILQQMDLINKINIAYEKALQDVIDAHGGIRNIDFDSAEKLARKKSDKEILSLKNEFKNIGKGIDKQYDKQISEFKSVVPKDRVAVRNKDGTIGHIPKDKLNNYLRDKAGELL
ncbi:MAG TPA: hypothetical protein VGK47_14845 [Nitrososphaeraceae archaeon]